jgi:PKD repeat protein
VLLAQDADFSITPIAPTPAQVVNYSYEDLCPGTLTSMLWTYGDGGSFTNTNPAGNGCGTTHGYDNLGVYRVILEVLPSQNQLVRDIGIRSNADGQNPLTPDFSWSPASPAPGQDVTFNDLTSPANSVGQWEWDFDDGSISYLHNPTKSFPIGDHAVTLKVGNQASLQLKTLTVHVTTPIPVASFTFSPTNPTPGTVVQFTDTSTGGPTSWSWNFGDPSSPGDNTSTLQNPTHVFSAGGAYTVALVASNANGSSTPFTQQVIVSTPTAPVADFSFNANRLTVAFTDTSTGGPDQWAWTFGDIGSPSNQSSAQNPTHVFSKEGTFTVSLTASNAAGSSSRTRTLTVQNGSSAPVAGFTSSAAGLDVAFTDTSTGPPTRWAWSFGDPASGGANLSTTQNPSHHFSAAGSYTVSLTVTNVFGSSTAQETLVVSTCVAGSETLCLNNARFKVAVTWSVPSQNRSGTGQAIPLTSDTGYFWFFDEANVELVIKVLDATGVNHHFWVFYGALSNVQYEITVTDTETGAVKVYDNPSGTLASIADTSAFPSAASPAGAAAEATDKDAEIDRRSAEELYGLYAVLSQAKAAPRSTSAGCTANSTTACLHQARFQVSVDWEVPSQGRSGAGTAIPITDDTGYFWFFTDTNVELMIKVLDGTGVNQHYWVFYGALSNVKYTITVRDTQTGHVKVYANESGNQASVADTAAF